MVATEKKKDLRGNVRHAADDVQDWMARTEHRRKEREKKRREEDTTPISRTVQDMVRDGWKQTEDRGKKGKKNVVVIIPPRVGHVMEKSRRVWCTVV